MASIKMSGAETVIDDLQKLASMSEDEQWAILSAGAEIIKAAHQTSIKALFKMWTWQLYNSIKVSRKISDGAVKAVIGPSGTRTKGYTGKRKNGKGSYAGTNAEVGYVLEYGSPRIKPRHWMEKANDAASDDMETAMAQAWDDRLRKLNL